MDTVIRRHVHTHQLQKILGRFATYAGSSPFLSPAILSVIAHVELNMGVWYPRGGVYEIARALEKLATDLGVRIHTQTEVMAIDYERGSGGRRKIRGVRTRSGEQYRTDCVIANLDATAIQEKLLPLDDLTRRRITHLERIQPSCSGFILFLGVEGRHPKLAHHNIFFSEDYQKEFQQIFNEGRPATDPTIYLAISSKTDPSHAPDGCENWFVLVNAPSCGRIKWEEEKENYARSILHRLADLGFDIRTQIRHQEVASPDDLEVRTGARKGSLYGMSFHSRLTPFRRPANRDTEIAGLYYVGGTTHPGGGVPMVILSSKVVAEMILEGHE